ncbi:DNA polymerase III subunit beta family protein [Kineococcus terrestris]|uniref:DNA polymerase III subunit beta family protein n=1 Tax=Kineococcus terrestris TaxID=2044856 RepID=UPI0034DAE1B6
MSATVLTSTPTTVRVQSSDLISALADVNAAMPRRLQRPLQHGVRISHHGGVLLIERTDGHTWAHAQLSTVDDVRALDLGPAGALVVSARALTGLVRAIGHGHELHLSLVDGLSDNVDDGYVALQLVGDGTTYRLLLLNTGDTWPTSQRSAGEHIATLTGEQLQQLTRAVTSADTDPTLPVLNHVYLEEHQGHLTASGTDRYRLTEVTVPTAVPDGFTALVPSSALVLAAKLARRDGSATLSLDRQETLEGKKLDALTFNVGAHRSLRVPLLDSPYPKVRSLWSDPKYTLHVERTALRQAVRRIAEAVSGHTPVVLHFTGTALTVRTNQQLSTSDCAASTTIPCQPGTLTEPFTTAVQPDFLLDGLDVVADERIALGLTHPTRPLILSAPDSPARYLLMPVRLRDGVL